jgi:hypothetical protein
MPTRQPDSGPGDPFPSLEHFVERTINFGKPRSPKFPVGALGFTRNRPNNALSARAERARITVPMLHSARATESGETAYGYARTIIAPRPSLTGHRWPTELRRTTPHCREGASDKMTNPTTLCGVSPATRELEVYWDASLADEWKARAEVSRVGIQLNHPFCRPATADSTSPKIVNCDF